MSTQSKQTAETEESDENDQSAVLSAVGTGGRSGTLAALAGGALLAGALRANSAGRRAGALALGGALLGVGLRKRRSDDGGSAGDAAGDQESTEAEAHLERTDVLNQSETNPRGVSGEPDVETETDPEEGDVQYTTERDERPESKPHLDDEEDPRFPDEEEAATDDGVEIDLSENAMADEASEATGPTDEQSYPASEGTDPEPTADEAPERHNEGAVSNTDTDVGDAGAGDGSDESDSDDDETV